MNECKIFETATDVAIILDNSPVPVGVRAWTADLSKWFAVGAVSGLLDGLVDVVVNSITE